MAEDFHALHQRRYGFSNEARPIEIVNVRVRMIAPAPTFSQTLELILDGDGRRALVTTRPVYFDGEFLDTRIYTRDRLTPGDTVAGPAIISEYSSATVLPPRDRLRVDALRNLVIEVHP